jgi:hypothetical protein
MFHFSKKLLLTAVFLLGAALNSQAQTTVFEDQFNTTAWDSAKWTAYGTDRYLQRTQFGGVPTMATENGVQFARFPLKTYNGDSRYSGTYLRGTEVFSKQIFNIGEGLEIEARIRGRNLPRGIVYAFVMYNERGQWPSTYLRDEIDFEYLTNFSNDQMWLNIWDDWNPERGGANRSTITSAAGLDRNNWHTFKIRWMPDVVEWFVDGVVVRRSTDILPADPMQIHFNIWAAASSWATAYDANLPVTAIPTENKTYYMDIDWVQVRTLPGAVVGSGTGLTGTYYNNLDFTGTSIQRIDPRVNFEWGYTPPASQIAEDTYSVRWTGQVQAQYTETYTFTARTDDGVRLWVNNQLIIDEWHNGSAEDYSGQINLVAGQKYDIKMEYYEDTGGAVAQLFWSNQRKAKELIPQSQLYPTNAPTANTAPSIAISSPVANRIYQSAPIFAGAARDAETSVMALSGLLYDYSRNRYWNGSAWTSTAVNFPISTPNGDWVYQLPPLLDGRFTVRIAAVDTQRKSSSSSVTFSINNKKPPVIVIQSPVANGVYSTKPAFNGTAKDAETSVLEVRGMIYDSTRQRYWTGSAWGTTAVYFMMTGKETWSYNMPTLQNGNYVARVLATDTWRNSSTVAVGFSVKSAALTTTVSSTTLSSAQAQNQTITLSFTGALGNTASNVATWIVSVNGQSVSPSAVKVNSETVTLTLPALLASGDEVAVSWPQLRDANGQLVTGSWQGTAN